MAKKRADWLVKAHDPLHAFINCAWIFLLDPARREKFGFGLNSGLNGIENTTSYWLDNVFKPLLDEYNLVYALWSDRGMRTMVITAKFYRIESEIKKLFRQLYAGFIKGNLFVQDEDLEAMGFPVQKPARIEVPVPHTAPAFQLHNKSPLVMTANFHDQGPNSTGRPYGVTFMEFRYVLWTNDSRTPGYDELIHSRYETTSPLKITFTMPDRGKLIYCAGRWINNRGKPGDWGDIVSGIVT